MENDRIDLIQEIELVRQAAEGSKEAFCELYGRYKDKLYRFALYRLRDPQDAEDAVSECVLAAWQGIDGLRQPEAFSAWIFRILNRCCAGRIAEAVDMREKIRKISDPSSGAVFTAPSGSDPSLPVELDEALAILGEDERTIVLLSVIGGLTSSELSGLTGLTPGAVRSKLSRSLAKMREFLS